MKKDTIRWVQDRESGELIARWNRHKTSIIAEHGPLGLYYGVTVNGKNIGGSNGLDRAKEMAMEKLRVLANNDADAQSVNRELSKLFGKPDPRKGEGSTPEEARRNAKLHSVR